MSSDIRARVATGTAQAVSVTRTLNVTDAKVAATLRDAARGLGINPNLTDAQLVGEIIEWWIQETARVARAYRRQQEITAAAVSIDATINADTAL